MPRRPPVCPCEVCRRFAYPTARESWPSLDKFCSICGRNRLATVDYIPPLAREFLKIDTICWACRNALQCYVRDGWELCWKDSPEKFLKFAMLDYIRSHVWPDEFRLIQLGYQGRCHFETEFEKAEEAAKQAKKDAKRKDDKNDADFPRRSAAGTEPAGTGRQAG